MKKTSLIVIVSLTVLIAAYIGIDFFIKWHKAGIAATETRQKSECDLRISVLEQKIQYLEEELFKEKGAHLSPEVINDAFGREITDLVSPGKGISPEQCRSLKQAVESFFYYLDNSGYSDRYGLKDGSLTYYKNVLTLLKRNPPNFAGESAELLNLFRSISHFSRVLGKKGALLIKDVLESESDMVEPALAVFYKLLNTRESCTDPESIPDLETMYQYANFFLNTVAGKSYLMRRNSKLRILACYYSLQVIRMAEKQSMNIYGFDPRPQAEILLYDVMNHRGLLYKDLYISQLKGIINQDPGLDFKTPEAP